MNPDLTAPSELFPQDAHGEPSQMDATTEPTASDTTEMPYQRFPVEVIRSAKRVKTVQARLVGGVIQVRVPACMTQEEEDEVVATLADRVERRHRCSHVSLEPRASRLAAKFDLPKPKSIRWSDRQQKTLWGSCTPGARDILISSRLADVPPWVLDHVIVHELAHLVYANHKQPFHDLVNRNPKAERAEGYLDALSDLRRRCPNCANSHRSRLTQ